jgi:serine/threonine-protein kinase
LSGRYVIKVLRPGLAQLRSAVDTFRSELTTIASLRHPHIVQVMEVGEAQDGRPFVVMERLAGRSLEARLGDGRPLPPDEVAALIKGLAGALQAAHGHGVFHRELHPGNIFLAQAEGHEHGFPKILNFGIARLRNASGGDAGFGAEEARYMAPEQAQGRAELIDGRSDEFALAAITYRLLVGADAFRGTDPIAVLYQVVHEPPAPMSAYAAIDPRIEPVVLRGLSKRQGERFDTVMEFARALEEAASGPTPRRERERVEPPAREVVGQPAREVVGQPAREVVRQPTPREAWEPEVRRPARERSYTPTSSGGVALPGGGVLLDEPAWEGVDDFRDLDRVPRQRGRLALFLTGFVIVGVAASLWAGWRPPLAWRQSRAWHALHLPGATGPAAGADRSAALGLSAHPSPAPASGEAAPAPGAPAMPVAGGASLAQEPPQPGAAAPAVRAAPPQQTALSAAPAAPPQPAAVPAAPPQPTTLSAAPVTAPMAQPTAVPSAAVARPQRAAAPAAAPQRAAPGAHAAKGKERRARHRESSENMSMRGVVWSDKEHRLVPVGSVSAEPPAPSPAPTSAPAVLAPPPPDAPAAVAPPAPTPTPAERPVTPVRPLSPEDAPLPLSKP